MKVEEQTMLTMRLALCFINGGIEERAYMKWSVEEPEWVYESTRDPEDAGYYFGHCKAAIHDAKEVQINAE